MARKYDEFRYTLDPEQIPTKKVLDINPECGSEVHVNYACPDYLWREHFDAWRKARQQGNFIAPDPMPWGHCMFERPTDYGCIPYGCTDKAIIRQAIEHRVRGLLNGWDRDMSKEQLDKIVKTTVDAKMEGKDVGVFPYLACVYSWLENK